MRDPRAAFEHLSRDAISTSPVNTAAKSRRSQYALRDRAVARGWPSERVP
jgi:hypothetical protein